MFFYLHRSGKNIFTNKSSSSGIYRYFNSSMRRVKPEQTNKQTKTMFKTALSVSQESFVWFLYFVLKNKKQNILSPWYILWRRGIGGHENSVQIFILFLFITSIFFSQQKADQYHDESVTVLNRDTIQKISKLLQVKEKILIDALTQKKATAGGETVVMNYRMEDVSDDSILNNLTSRTDKEGIWWWLRGVIFVSSP